MAAPKTPQVCLIDGATSNLLDSARNRFHLLYCSLFALANCYCLRYYNDNMAQLIHQPPLTWPYCWAPAYTWTTTSDFSTLKKIKWSISQCVRLQGAGK